jgi:hypothetical protein
MQTASDAAERPGDHRTVERLGRGWVAEEALSIALHCVLATDNYQAVHRWRDRRGTRDGPVDGVGDPDADRDRQARPAGRKLLRPSARQRLTFVNRPERPSGCNPAGHSRRVPGTSTTLTGCRIARRPSLHGA